MTDREVIIKRLFGSVGASKQMRLGRVTLESQASHAAVTL